MQHITVLLKEAVDNLNVRKNKIYVDATLGGGGHSEEILKRLDNTGLLIGIDQDDYAIEKASKRLAGNENFKVVKSNFVDLRSKLKEIGIEKIDGILFDLGLSSFQIDDKSRGFSYLSDDELDMRMDKSSDLTAKKVVNEYSYEDLVRILFQYGEEKMAVPIVKEIIKRRPVNTTKELVAICDKINYKVKGHSAKRVFQALRIEVNQELDVLDKVLNDVSDLLNPCGRLCVITFHSLEDRIVKHFIKKMSELNIPKNMPIPENLKPDFKKITLKPILPSDTEQDENPRSKSAKLRVAEKL